MTLFAENNVTHSSRKVEHLNLFEILTTNKEKSTTFTPDMDSDTIVKIIVDSMMVELRKEFDRVGLTPKHSSQ